MTSLHSDVYEISVAMKKMATSTGELGVFGLNVTTEEMLFLFKP